MPTQLPPPCCGARTCQRTQPIRLVFEAGRWWFATAYAECADGPREVFQRHAVHVDDVKLLERRGS